MDLAHHGELIGRTRLAGWRGLALRTTFSVSLGFNQLFEATHPPVAALYAFVPAQLTWMWGVPAWVYLLNGTVGVATLVLAYLTARRRLLTVFARRRLARAIRWVRPPPGLPSWLFA